MSNLPTTQQNGQSPPHIKAAKILNRFIERESAIQIQQDQPDIEGELIGFWGYWLEQEALQVRKIRKESPDVAEYLDHLCQEEESLEESAPKETPPKPVTKTQAQGSKIRKDRIECPTVTWDRLEAIAADVCKNLVPHLDKDEFGQFVTDKYDIFWKELLDPTSGTFLNLDEQLTKFIADIVNAFLASGMGEEKAPLLHPWTSYYLNQLVPEWGERFHTKLACIGPHISGCNGCRWLDGCRANWLKWAVRIPLFITRGVMKDISGNGIKVLLCIANHATWIPSHPHFGMCWLGYDQIRAETGIKQPHAPIKELQEKKLIKLEQIRRKRDDQQITTTNCFTVNWFHQLRELGIEGYYTKPPPKQRKGV